MLFGFAFFFRRIAVFLFFRGSLVFLLFDRDFFFFRLFLCFFRHVSLSLFCFAFFVGLCFDGRDIGGDRDGDSLLFFDVAIGGEDDGGEGEAEDQSGGGTEEGGDATFRDDFGDIPVGHAGLFGSIEASIDLVGLGKREVDLGNKNIDLLDEGGAGSLPGIIVGVLEVLDGSVFALVDFSVVGKGDDIVVFGIGVTGELITEIGEAFEDRFFR